MVCWIKPNSFSQKARYFKKFPLCAGESRREGQGEGENGMGEGERGFSFKKGLSDFYQGHIATKTCLEITCVFSM